MARGLPKSPELLQEADESLYSCWTGGGEGDREGGGGGGAEGQGQGDEGGLPLVTTIPHTQALAPGLVDTKLKEGGKAYLYIYFNLCILPEKKHIVPT